MDRRDTAARLPGVHPDLVGLSDEELAERARGASVAELDAIAAEADRRQTLAATFPGGSLADDLTGTDEDTLGWALSYATADEAERIAAEIDRRHPPTPLPAAANGATIDGQLADRAAIDAALGPIGSPDQWPHLAPEPPDNRTDTERWLAQREQDAQAARTAYTREQVREMYREHTYAQYLDAEDELRGVLLSRQAEADGVDPMSLFTGPAHVAYARASEELKRYWQTRPRTTLAEYNEQVTGAHSAAGETARKSRDDRQNRL